MSISSKRFRQDLFQTIRRYYTSPKFALIDLTFAFFALFANPYRTCRKFLQKKKQENIYGYGETPYATYERIVEQCEIGPNDIWLEMGAGRGKGCFWLSHFVKCKVIAIEWVPQFVYIARFIKALFKMNDISFELNDMEKVSLPQATVLYLYGPWPNLEIPPNTKVIAISEPLQGMKVIKSFWVRYPWGRTAAFLQTNFIS